MELVDQKSLERHLASENAAKLYSHIDVASPFRKLKCQEWLEATPAKRMIFERLYGDILQSPSQTRVVDVGGGLTALTPVLAANSSYCLIDPLHHDSPEAASAAISACPPFQIQRCDWRDATPEAPADIIIANDLFPNVDQRLGLFLDWALARAGAVRMSLTFYNTSRWYQAQRVGGDERLCVLAYDGKLTLGALAPYADRIAGWRPDLFRADQPSVYPNGRHVVLVELKGGT